eukprot:384282_1
MTGNHISEYLKKDKISEDYNLSQIANSKIYVIHGKNVMEYEEKEMQQLEEKWDSYNKIRSSFLGEPESASKQAKYLEMLEEIQTDKMSSLQREQIIIDDIIDDHKNYYKIEMDKCKYRLGEAAAKIEDKLRQEIDDIECVKDRFCIQSIPNDKGIFEERKIHKSSIMKTLFSDNNVEYYNNRVLNTQRVAMSSYHNSNSNQIRVVSTSTDNEKQYIVSGAVGVSLVKLSKKLDDGCIALFQVVQFKKNGKYFDRIEVDEIDDDTIYIGRYATRIKIDVVKVKQDGIYNNIMYLSWGGTVAIGPTTKFHSKHSMFPAWNSHSAANVIIYEELSTVHRYAKLILTDIINDENVITNLICLSD